MSHFQKKNLLDPTEDYLLFHMFFFSTPYFQPSPRFIGQVALQLLQLIILSFQKTFILRLTYFSSTVVTFCNIEKYDVELNAALSW